MERENFYILLELSISPPETDSKIIEAAISKKQSEWSRLRNHPTKGLQAQKFITLIPEMRRVMSDARLRAQELKAALDSLLKDKENKYADIDRHIDILMGKGFISRDEVIKLAQVHELDESAIQSRINAKKDEKLARIDRQISLRVAKGYVTESEIERLAKRHDLTQDEIKTRIRCPILKNENESGDPPREIDRSIEKAIRESLKIVGRTSLYDFLGLPESALLESLQGAAAAKKQELASVSRKDADLTAGNTLAGHCVTIFRSEDTRISYDVSLAKSKLAELDSDIDISSISGKILPEYFDILAKKAYDFGMERDEAENYIREYCKRKNLRIELPQAKRRKYTIAGAVAAVLMIAAISVGFFYYQHLRATAREIEFAALLDQGERENPPEKALGIYAEYVRKRRGQNGYEDFIQEAEKRIGTIRNRAGESLFATVAARVREMTAAGDYTAALAALDEYLKTAPPADFVRKADAEISEIRKMIEIREFEVISRLMIEGRTDEKIEAIRRYMEAYPKGEHAGRIEQMLKDLANEYYIFVKNSLDTLEGASKWEECAALAQGYVDRYDNSHSDQLREMIDLYKTRIHDNQIYMALLEKAGACGEEYEKGIGLLTDYLDAYPDAAFKGKIVQEIERLQKLSRIKTLSAAEARMRALLNQTGGRFSEKTAGVVVDSRTGLMWTLIDSSMVNPEKTCFTFDEASQYVDRLDTGGFSDWRLPTAGELAGIISQTPCFPVVEEKWYWTAASFSGYSEGWYKIVETLSNAPNSGIIRKDSRECGTVRAVRGK